MDLKPIEPISFPAAQIYPKAWGKDGVGEIWIINNSHYCLKILQFAAGKDFSMHFHQKHETWYVAEGQLLMEYYDLSNADLMKRTLNVGDIVHVPAGNPHKLTSILPSTIYEVSTTCYDWDSSRIGKGSSQKEQL